MKLNVKMNMVINNVESGKLNTNIGSTFLNTQTLNKDDLIEYKCLSCNENYQKKFNENFKKAIF